MRYIPFIWREVGPIEAHLTIPIVRASVKPNSYCGPDSVTLWHSDGTGLRIQSKMEDIAERIEVGVLEFSIVNEIQDGELQVELPKSFNARINVKKLAISQSGAITESGIIIETEKGEKITITAGVYPYTLAVKGVVSMPHVFDPEYPLESYQELPWR